VRVLSDLFFCPQWIAMARVQGTNRRLLSPLLPNLWYTFLHIWKRKTHLFMDQRWVLVLDGLRPMSDAFTLNGSMIPHDTEHRLMTLKS
jgi:hypothetical protein